LEEEVGSPKIRWGETLDNREGSFDGTIKMLPPAMDADREIRRDIFIAEAAHAKQRKEKPYATAIQFAKDMVRTIFTSIRMGKSLGEAQNELYDIPGTLEYEAHQIIEPQLAKKIDIK
jgi:hypothetical protein